MEIKIYRIYTENKKNLLGIVNCYFKNATIYNGIGLFQGIKEKYSIIEIIDYDNLIIRGIVFKLANIIKREYNQKSVLITIQDVKVINV